jgi:hypothetical protein
MAGWVSAGVKEWVHLRRSLMSAAMNLNLARLLVVVGFLAGWNSLGATVAHIGNDAFLLTPQAPITPTHAWHHYWRELGAQFGTMSAILLMLFAPARFRTPVAWWAMLLLMIGFYGPFWAGLPFDRAYGAPNIGAEINHLSMAIPALAGCLLARRHFAGTAPVSGEVV